MNAVPRSIDLKAIPSPSEETGVEIGSIAGQRSNYKHPSEAEYWIGIEIDGQVVGYNYLPHWELEGPPEKTNPNCRPGMAIYDGQGSLVGGFIDGHPILVNGEQK